VSAETKARIQRLAHDMGYSPDAQARSLVMGRTKTIGIVVTTIADPFIGEIVQAVESTAHDHGYTVILVSSNAEPDREMKAVDTLRSKRVDGVIVTSSRIGALYHDYLEQLSVPVVLINSHSRQGGLYTFAVNVDNWHGGCLATDHLIQLGHRRIAYLTGPADHSDDLDRLAGYRQALAEAGIPFDPVLVVPGTGGADGGERALPVLRALQAPPTAAFCYNDVTAIGLMHAARQAGLSVPGDLAVVGFDDIPFALYIYPSLTTIAQPKLEMGKCAVEMMLALVSDRDRASATPPTNGGQSSVLSDIVVQGRLVERESSTGPQGGTPAN
jgi:DNA-binding LacI/PurR family transcriptional regulator